MTMLICSECRRENEPERIYCHDCGARLDRSGLAKTAQKEEGAEATHRRVKAMFDGRRAKMQQRFFAISKLILGALAVAAVVQLVRPPDLPEVPKMEMLPRQINLDLETAAMDPRTPPLRYAEADVNAYLAYVMKGKQAALSKWLNFERAVLDLEEGYVGFTVERSIFGLSVFTTGSYAINLQNGAIALKTRGGYLGRMPVQPSLMQYAEPYLFGDVAKALERERKLIMKLGTVELHPQTVTFAPKQPLP